MGVELSLAGGPYPYLCVLYRCSGCGAAVVRHGAEACTPPQGWRVEHDGSDGERALCPRCCG